MIVRKLNAYWEINSWVYHAVALLQMGAHLDRPFVAIN